MQQTVERDVDCAADPSSLVKSEPEVAIEARQSENVRADVRPVPFRIPSLDGLRAIAIATVLLSKYAHSLGLSHFVGMGVVDKMAGLGVDLFFVISGFLITTLLLREQEKTGTISLKNFYLRRALRILPAWFALLGVLAVVQSWNLISLTTWDWITAFTWTVNFLPKPSWDMGHGWSLSVEEHFYFVWPLTLVLLGTRRGFLGLTTVVIAGFLLRWAILLKFNDWTNWAEFATFTRIDGIAAGCFLALAQRSPDWTSTLDRWSRQSMFWPVWGMGFLVTLTSMVVSTKTALGVGCVLSALVLALLVWAAVRNPLQGLGRVLNHPGMVWMGTLSYSFYIWHRLIFRRPDLGWELTESPFSIVELSLLAIVSFYLIERPFLSLKDRLGQTKSHG